MAEPEMTAVCLLALLVVFVVLAVLSAAMYLMTVLFPARRTGVEAAALAAVAAAVASLVPGARVTRVEEEP